MTKRTQDQIFIEALKIPASVGIFDWEKKISQELVVDCELGYPLHKAGKSNLIDDTISYAEVAETIKAETLKQHWDLLEHLAEALVNKIFETFPVSAMTLRIAKPGAVPDARSVGVRIYREKPE